jgi:hypothetical protein
MVGRVQGDNWWTVHTPGTNSVIVQKYPSRFNQEGKRLPEVKDQLPWRRTGALNAKQDAVGQMGLPANLLNRS